jgi:hypothetical protein
MARNSRWASSPLRALTFALFAQVSLVDAQVAEIEKASNDSLLWGPYRPNLYFGVRPRIPKSLMGGLMWTKVEDHTVQHSKSQLCYPASSINQPLHSFPSTVDIVTQLSDTLASSMSLTATDGTNTMYALVAVKQSTTPRTTSTSRPSS